MSSSTAPSNPDFRAEGTFNENGIRGYGLRGLRVFDFGWQRVPKGWGDRAVIQMRLQMHATEPDSLEARLGSPQSKGCVRIPTALNRLLDHYGVLDAEYEKLAREGRQFWVLKEDREAVSELALPGRGGQPAPGAPGMESGRDVAAPSRGAPGTCAPLRGAVVRRPGEHRESDLRAMEQARCGEDIAGADQARCAGGQLDAHLERLTHEFLPASAGVFHIAAQQLGLNGQRVGRTRRGTQLSGSGCMPLDRSLPRLLLDLARFCEARPRPA